MWLVWAGIVFLIVYIVLRILCTRLLYSVYHDVEADTQRNPDDEYHTTIHDAVENIPCYSIDHGIPIMTKKRLQDVGCLNRHIIPLLFTKSMTTNSGSDNRENRSDFFSMLYAFLMFVCDDRYAIATSTGGTSGTSFYYWYNKSDTAELLKSYMYCWRTFGWEPSKKVLVYYGHPSSGGSFIKYFSFCNVNALIPSFHDGDITESSIVELLATIEQTRPYILESMPNFMFRVAQYMYRKGIVLTHKIRGLSLSGDFLFRCQYDFIRRVFGPDTTVLMSYGAVEFGQIAQQASEDDLYPYRIVPTVARVENIGDNLAITRFRFRNMPIIRYLIDDMGAVTADGAFIKNLVGKNKKGVDLIGINNAVESLRCAHIINVRIRGRTLVLTTLEPLDLEYLTGYSVESVRCDAESCATSDNMEGKVTPVLAA